MLANFEKRAYNGTERVWTGRYRNLHNLPHWHLENELICVEQGQATVSHNHQEYLLTEGDAIFLGSGEIHYIKSDPDSITAITLFDAALTASLTNCCQLCCAKLSTDYDILHVFSQIQEELQQRRPFFEQQTCLLLLQLMIRIFREEATVPMTAQPGTFFHLQLQKSTEQKLKGITVTSHFRMRLLSWDFPSLIFRGFSARFPA